MARKPSKKAAKAVKQIEVEFINDYGKPEKKSFASQKLADAFLEKAARKREEKVRLAKMHWV